MQLHLLILYQACSNNGSVAKNDPVPEVTLFTSTYIENRKSPSETTCYLLYIALYSTVVFFQICSKFGPGAKIFLTPGVTRGMVRFQLIPIYTGE